MGFDLKNGFIWENENQHNTKTKPKIEFCPNQMRQFFNLDYVVLNSQFEYIEIINQLIPFMNSNCRLIIHDRFYEKINSVYNYLKNLVK